MTETEERALIERAAAGEAAAFEPLVEAYQSRVYTICLRMLGNEEDAADAAQEAFIRAYTSLASFRFESRFSTWLTRLTGNVCLDMLRKRRRSRVISFNDMTGEEDDAPPDIPDDRFSPEDELEKKELRAAVREALDRLPEEYRHILVLRCLCDMSYEELAETLHLEIGTVKSRLNRARKKMCAMLLQDGNLSAVGASKQ